MSRFNLFSKKLVDPTSKFGDTHGESPNTPNTNTPINPTQRS